MPADARRTFVAVFPPPDALEAIEALRRRLEPAVPGLRWTRPRNLHFTLRFFGDLSPEDVATTGDAVAHVVAGAVPFPLEVARVGVFPSWKRPRVLWVGTRSGGEVLRALARSLDRAFDAVGLGRADKAFIPHLTVGRWRDGHGFDAGTARSAAEAEGLLTVFPVSEVVVVRSELGQGAPRYAPVRIARLGASGDG